MVLVVFLYSILGFTITLSKIILAHASPLFLVSTRMICAGILLLSLSVKKHWGKYVPTKTDWILLFQFMIFGVIATHVSRTWALQHVSTIKTALMFNLAPFFSAIFGYILLREKLTLLQLSGLIIGFLGTLPLILKNPSASNGLGICSNLALPDIVILIAVASLSYSLFIMQKLVKQRNCPPFIANGLTMLCGGFFAFNASCLTEDVWIKGKASTFVLLLIVNIALSNVLCANLQAWLLKKHSSTFIAFASFLTPLFAAIYGGILLNEQVSFNFFVSFVVVLIGLTLYFYEELRSSTRTLVTKPSHKAQDDDLQQSISDSVPLEKNREQQSQTIE